MQPHDTAVPRPAGHREAPKPPKYTGFGGFYFQLRQPSRNLYVDSGFWSYPALAAAEGRVYWLHILCDARRDDRTCLVFRPRAMATTPPDSTVLVRYENFRLGADPLADVGWDEPVGKHPHPAIWEWTEDVYRKKEESLISLYRSVHEEFLLQGSLPDSFRHAYLEIVNPLFLPFIRRLAPDFYKALGPAVAPDESTGQGRRNRGAS